jgi:uncharacterized protein YgiM (DUF1202 family)
VAPAALPQIPGNSGTKTWGKVKPATLNVRAAMSTHAIIAGKLLKNAIVEILDTSGSWYKVLQASTGLIGYVSTAYVAKTAEGPASTPYTGSPTPTASPTPTPSGSAAGPSATPTPLMGRVMAATLTMRSQPGTSGSAVYTLKKNDSVLILDAYAADNWYKVQYASYAGYCMAAGGTTAYIEIIGSAPSPTGSSTPAPTGPVTLVPVTAKANVSDYLAIRASASTSAAKVGQIPAHATFTVLQVCSATTWLKISYSGSTGYVLAKYAAVLNNTSYRACTVTVSQLNVRSGAGTGYGIIGTLKSGDTVVMTAKVTSSSGTWYKIKFGTYTGYIDTRYARISTN